MFFERRQWAAPNHIVYGDINTEEDFFARLKVDNAHQIGMIETEEIGEVAVLAVDLGVVERVEGCFVVGGEEGDTLRNHLFQGGATATVNVFCKHSLLFLFNGFVTANIRNLFLSEILRKNLCKKKIFVLLQPVRKKTILKN